MKDIQMAWWSILGGLLLSLSTTNSAAQEVIIDSVRLGSVSFQCDTVFKARSLGASLNLQHFEAYSDGLIGIATTPDSLFFLDFSFSGELRRSQSYKPHPTRSSLIQQLAIHNDLAYVSGFLSGSASTYLGILLKFNIQSFELEWYSQGNDPGVIWWQVFPEDDEVVAIGTSHTTGQEIIITKFDPATGQRISDVTGYDQLDAESLYRTRKVNDKYYSVGRISTDRRGSSGMRHAQIIWDSNFNLETSKAYMRFGQDVSRLYPYAMTTDDDFIYSISSGMYDGTANVSGSVYLQITDLDGAPIDTKEIRFPGATALATQAFYADSTLYVTGTLNARSESFILAFDRFSFAPLFAHRFDRYSTRANFGCQVVESPQGLKLAVSELAPDNSSILSIFPLDRTGIEPTTTCASINTFAFQISDLPDRVLDITMDQTSRSESSTILNLSSTVPELEKSICTIACEDCTPSEVWGTLVLCAGETYSLSNGQSISNAGEYDVVLISESGCDSLLHLTVLEESNTSLSLEASLCEGSSVNVLGQTYTEGGVYTPRISGTTCDVEVNLTVQEFPSYSLFSPLPSCDEQSLLIDGISYNVGDTLIQTFTTSQGCDSILQSPIVSSTSFSESFTAQICNGSTYTFEGNTYNESGTYTANYQTSSGCDSTLTLVLSVVSEIFTADEYVLCTGDTLLIDGLIILGDTTWQVQSTSFSGCDSTHTVTVTSQENPSLEIVSSLSSCNGDSTGALIVSASGASATTIQWSTGAEGESISNLPPGVYTARVSDEEGCNSSVDVAIEEKSPASLGFDISFPSCEGDQDGRISIGPPDSIFSSSLPDFGSVEHVYQNLPSGAYSITIIDINGCVLDTVLMLEEGQGPPLLSHDSPITVSLGDSVRLRPIFNPSHKIRWQDSTDLIVCDTCANPWVTPLSSTSIELEVTDDSGCTNTTELTLLVIPGPTLGVPTAFSPNGDGVNDRWQPKLPTNVERIEEITVFNRWGNIVFKQNGIPSNDPSFGWDGYYREKLMNPDVFVFLVQYKLIDGTTNYISGDLTLFR